MHCAVVHWPLACWSAVVSLACFTHASAGGVRVGESLLIGELDYCDTFTVGEGTRADLPWQFFPIGGAYFEALRVEDTAAHPEMYWSDALWSLASDAQFSNGIPAYPGPSGAGSDTGMTQTGNAVDYGIEYDLREDFVVQFDAVQTPDRVNITIGEVRDRIADDWLPSGLSVFFRAPGHAEGLPMVGIYNAAVGEVITDLDTSAAGVEVGQWNNYAVRFNLPEQELTVYVNQIKLGVLDLKTLGGELVRGGGTVEPGAFAALVSESSNDAVSVGASGGNRVWTDNFQVGAPRLEVPLVLLPSLVQLQRDPQGTREEGDDTLRFTVRVDATGPVSEAGWKLTVEPAVVSGPRSGAYGETVVFTDVPVGLAPITLTFADAANESVTATLTISAPPAPFVPKNFAVPVGASTLIGELDYTDTFTLGHGTREALTANLYPIGDSLPEALVIEESYGNPEVSWSNGRWSLSRDAEVINGEPAYPGNSGGGSDTGMTQTGGNVDFGIEYGLRRDFVVQFDAVQIDDRINITIGTLRDDIATEANEGGLSVFFRADSRTDLSRVGIYHALLGEVDAGLGLSELGIEVGEWHNYAVRFNLLEAQLVLYVDQRELGTVDLMTLGGVTVDGREVPVGEFARQLNEFSNAVVNVGGYASRGNRVWTDNFQVGAPVGAVVPPDRDSDGDRVSDADEAIAGTDPQNPASVWRVTSISRVDGGVAVRFPSVAGRFYRLYTSVDLRIWARDDHAGTLSGTGAELAPVVPTPAEDVRFYRVLVREVDDFPAGLP